MTVPILNAVDFGGPAGTPVILLGPSLGTSTATLWGGAARVLKRQARVIGWDLPGHGRSEPAGPFTLAELAAGVLLLADQYGAETFHYAGNSVGGAVGIQLLLDAAQRVRSATLLCTGAAIGTPNLWRDRAATVRGHGIYPMLDAAARRWFAPGFTDREPGRSASLLDSLRHTDPESYALTCDALADFDVEHRLPEITQPVLAVAGSDDVATPPESLQRIASGVKGGAFVVLDGVAHLAPAEAPDRVAALIADRAGLTQPGDKYQAGMIVRREVLGDAHVDRAIATATELTADFQRMITEYAWGTIWTRPGLDRRSRSMITLTALIAHGHHEELAMHVNAARRNGLTDDEIKELIMQTAIYCGVPAANTAFRIASDVR
ncbi:4-carboxymuconolactone decarboxylase [Mycolicibacterium iranicum]|uniref:3-oxoadipate enol-lactonase n=1 Tax=Mycolicibacterium iranicum TaxID=912594 RepID=A0A178LWB5_MYCIR|nr:4-carboxymuconolactone decarboxylase [Mycolicibacterium iranicum]OAN38628.1 3-oxoadipate enol-lactonase [Mycolicibacterium iranicum]